MKRSITLLTVTFAILFAVPPLAAQQDASEATEKPAQEGNLFLIYEEQINPWKMPEFEAASKDFIAAMTEAGVDSPHVRYETIQMSDFSVLYVTPLESFGSLDALFAQWMAMSEKVGQQRWQELLEAGAPTIDHVNSFIVRSRPDLSYQPEQATLTLTEAPFLHYDLYYLRPGSEQKAEEVATAYREAFARHDIDRGYMIYQGVLGDDLPVLAVAIPARSAADYASHNAEVLKTLGEEGEELAQRAMELTRRFETREGRRRPDLSYPPQKEEKTP